MQRRKEETGARTRSVTTSELEAPAFGGGRSTGRPVELLETEKGVHVRDGGRSRGRRSTGGRRSKQRTVVRAGDGGPSRGRRSERRCRKPYMDMSLTLLRSVSVSLAPSCLVFVTVSYSWTPQRVERKHTHTPTHTRAHAHTRSIPVLMSLFPILLGCCKPSFVQIGGGGGVFACTR